MYQMNLELRFPMDEQLLLPLDYTGCDTRTYSNSYLTTVPSGSFIVSTGSGLVWKDPNPIQVNTSKLEVDELVVKKPFKSLVGTIKSLYSPWK
jgi:hypothetical protein